jgi:endonuclease III related protein
VKKPINKFSQVYQLLLDTYGNQDWWPAETPFEVCVGAILTQNTNWGNVEKAIRNLKAAGCLTMEALATLSVEELAEPIRPAGFFNVKSARLKEFVRFVGERADGDLARLFRCDWQELRQVLLTVKGIGPETADSILLYAGNKPSFVVDAYTRRIFSRLGMVDQATGYEQLRGLFMAQLPQEPALFNEYHALIVEHAKRYCKTRPVCAGCCLADCCSFALKI